MRRNLARCSVLAATAAGFAIGCTDPDALAPGLVDSLGSGPSVVPVNACGSIHAVLIATSEGLADCTTAAIASPPLSPLGDRCDGLTADECAQEHYARAELHVRPRGRGSFELRYLPAELGLHCADGTRPHYYVSPGAGADASRWIIYQNGSSGKCVRRKDHDGVFREAGPDCFAQFASGAGDSGFARKERWEGRGILDGGARNVDFRDWNRVWIPSCSNDQYQGSIDHPSERVLTSAVAEWHAPLFSRGFDIVMAVIDQLAVGAEVNDLSDATLVMLYGSSGGAGGMQMTLDAKAEHVAAVSSARVVGLLDSRAEPNLAGAEGLFDGTSCGSIFAADCPASFDLPPGGTDLTAGFAFDTSAYQPATAACPGCGTGRLSAEWWGNNLDESCVDHHGAASTPCYDGYHVVYEHTSTPVFHATSLRDHNQYNNPIEYVAIAEGEVSFQSLETASCGALPRERVIGQLDAYAAFRDAAAGGAHGASEDAGPIGIWAIDWVDHEITKDAGIFNDAALDGITLSAAIRDWAVAETPVQLVEAPGHATRTAAPTIPEKTNHCP
jgi:hypothetical protein